MNASMDREYALLAAYDGAWLQTRKLGWMSQQVGLSRNLHQHTSCTAPCFGKRKVSENSFHRKDSAAPSRSHEICARGILYTRVLLRQSKRVSAPRPNALHPNIRYQNQNCRVQQACASTISQNRTQRADRACKTDGKHSASTL